MDARMNRNARLSAGFAAATNALQLRWSAQFTALVLGALLAGCPASGPQLDVSPQALFFGANDTTKSVTIRNLGGGELQWELYEDLPWLEVLMKQNEPGLAGVVREQPDVLQLTVNRAALSVGANSGEIRIVSNGGEEVVAVSAMQGGAASLEVDTTEIDFGYETGSATFTIMNRGSNPLDWTAAVPEGQDWLQASPTSGTVSAGESGDTVTLSVDRSALSPGTYTADVAVNSGGGAAVVAVSVDVPIFTATPLQIDFDTLRSARTRFVSILNQDFSEIQIAATAATDDGGAWLTLGESSITIPGQAPYQLPVNADPSALAPGNYQGTITLREAGTGYTQQVLVMAAVSNLSAAPDLLDFGTITASQSATFDLSAAGAGAVAFTVEVPQAAQPWVSVSPASGNVEGTAAIEVTVTPDAVAPGQHETDLRVVHDTGAEVVAVRFMRPQPAELAVSPREIDFGGSRVQESLAIWNRGVGEIGWRIDASTFPAWLRLTPVDGSGVASGSVSGELTDQVLLEVDRNLTPPGQFQFEHTFSVEASGDSEESVELRVSVDVPPVPAISIAAEGVDDAGLPYLNVDTTQDQETFTVTNTGAGTLSWNLEQENLPDWIASAAPAQGSLEPGETDTVTIVVDRATLDYRGAQQVLTVTSNAPATPQAQVLLEVLVPKTIAIGVRPGSLSFGLDASSDILEVANTGDPGTTLNFLILSNKEWLGVYPEAGSSVGIDGPFKDWQPVSVTVDRALLEGTGASGKLTVVAYTVENSEQRPLEDVEPVEVEVTLEAAELSIEAAKPRTRIPSLVRYVLMLRNLRYNALPIPPSEHERIGNQFTVVENDTPLELSETNQFVTSASRLRTNVLVLLDYSGSMQQAAGDLVATGQLGDGASVSDPLQLLYEQTIIPMIAEMPDDYRIGIGVFSERSGEAGNVVRAIRPDVDAPIFVADKEEVIARLDGITVRDNGATQLLPAITRGAELLADEDSNFLIPFDDADVRALICVTDGRLTTPPGTVTDVVDVLEAQKVRLFAIGWGNQVIADPLIRMSAGSGGHYYATRTEPTGAFDAFGRAIRRPLYRELLDWAVTDEMDACDQSIPRDLRSQIVLSYVTLAEEANLSVELQLSFDDPNDQDSVCLPEQGVISGSIEHRQLDFESIAGEPRLGQISLMSQGLETETSTAELIVRAEYMPRNITQMQFQISSDSGQPFDAALVSQLQGGAVHDWTLQRAGDVFTLTSPDGTPVQYGTFGDMLRLTFDNVNAPFRVFFEVLAPEYDPSNGGNNESKFFTHPDAIPVTGDGFKATAFPRPGFRFSGNMILDDPVAIDLGANATNFTIDLFNSGGSHVIRDIRGDIDRTRSVGLGYLIETSSGFITAAPKSGFLTSTLDEDIIAVGVDRNRPAGTYYEDLLFLFNYGRLNVELQAQPIRVVYDVAPPQLSVTPTALDFGAVDTELPVTLSNLGDGAIAWDFVLTDVPQWLALPQAFGFLGPQESSIVNTRIDRGMMAPGTYQYGLRVVTDLEDPPGTAVEGTILIQMTVP